jgi:hypothetical protein
MQKSNVLIALELLLLGFLSFAPRYFVDHFYIPYFFKPFSLLLRNISGIFPFSVGLVLVYICIPFLLYKAFVFFKKRAALNFKPIAISILSIYIVYMLLWGILYQKTPLADTLNLKTNTPSKTELDSLCGFLVSQTNEHRLSLNQKLLESSTKTILKEAKQIFSKSAIAVPKPVIKPAIGSTLLAYMSTAGVYNFISAEANVNSLSLAFDLPNTALHELAHLAGFAAEDEANYWAYKLATGSNNTLFKYSACYNTVFKGIRLLASHDSLLAQKHFKNLDPNVILDFEKEQKHWLKYQNPIQKYLVAPFYNFFLKSNGQTQGSLSYDLVIELIIAERKKQASKASNISS